MRTIATLAAAAALVAVQASAQTVPLDHLSRIDQNGDGAVTREEFDTFAASAFQMLDTNGDRQLSAAEAEGHVEDGAFADLDANGDGMVTRQEFGQQMTTEFAAADKDGNGIID